MKKMSTRVIAEFLALALTLSTATPVYSQSSILEQPQTEEILSGASVSISEAEPELKIALDEVESTQALSMYSDNVIYIKSVTDMEAIPEEASGKYVLENDITLDNWNSIRVLSGEFDGNGHTITLNNPKSAIGDGGSYYNMDVYFSLGNKSGSIVNYINGLFRKNTGTVKNLFINYTVTISEGEGVTNINAGAVTAYNEGTIDNVSANVNINVENKGKSSGGGSYRTTYSNSCVGSIAGSNDKGTISNCNAYGTITAVSNGEKSQFATHSGYDYVGGINGGYGNVSNCSASNINLKGTRVGGISGYASLIEDCEVYNANISGEEVAGVAYCSGITRTTCMASLDGEYSGGLVIDNAKATGLYGKNFCRDSFFAGTIKASKTAYALAPIYSNVEKCYSVGDIYSPIINVFTRSVKDSFSRSNLHPYDSNGLEKVAFYPEYFLGNSAKNTYFAGTVDNAKTYTQIESKDVVSSYYNNELLPNISVNLVDKNTAEMKLQDSYEGWDFENTWAILQNRNDGYPILRSFSDVKKCNIMFDDNELESKELYYGETLTMPEATGSKGELYIFAGWSINKNSLVAEFEANKSYSFADDTKLYPVYKKVDSISGKCGDNAIWTLDILSGKLTISGSNGTYDYSSQPTEFAKYANYIKIVDISGISTINNGLLKNLSNVTQINISDSVKIINAEGLATGSNIDVVKFGAFVNFIGEKVVSGTINNVYIYDKTASIDTNAFTSANITNVYVYHNSSADNNALYQSGTVIQYLDKQKSTSSSSGGGGGGGSSSSSYYTVSFNTLGGSILESVKVKKNAKLSIPNIPIRENYTFTKWYTDKECTKEYDFKNAVNKSFTLYAGWTKNELDVNNTKKTVTENKIEETTVDNYKKIKVTIGDIYADVNGINFEMDVAPYIQPSSNSTLVPLRFVTVALLDLSAKDADKSNVISWDANTKTASVHMQRGDIEFTAGSNKYIVNGRTQEMPNGVNAEITDGRMFIPFRALGEALNVEVDWEAETKTAVFTVK